MFSLVAVIFLDKGIVAEIGLARSFPCCIGFRISCSATHIKGTSNGADSALYKPSTSAVLLWRGKRTSLDLA